MYQGGMKSTTPKAMIPVQKGSIAGGGEGEGGAGQADRDRGCQRLDLLCWDGNVL